MTEVSAPTIRVGGPGPVGSALAFLGHLYPLMSGRGTIANLPLLKRVFSGQSRIAWARVGAARCLVPLDDYVGRAAFIFGDLDRKVTWVIDRCVQPGDTVLDVGANLGVVTLLLAQKAGPTGAVHAFEPSPKTLSYLRETVRQAAPLPIYLYEVAVGANEGSLNLSTPPENAGAASLVKAHTREGTTNCQVPVRRLADILSSAGIGEISFMKIDVEGYEMEALRGLMEGENRRHPRVMVLEEHSPEQSPALNFLRSQQYSIYGIQRAVLRAPRLIPSGDSKFLSCHDFVALHAGAALSLRRTLKV